MRVTLNELFVRHLKADGAQHKYVCNRTPSFGLRLSQRGGKSFFAFVGGKYHHLGKYPQTSLAEARKAASALLDGATRARPSLSFLEAKETYLAAYVRPNYRPRSAKEVERLLSRCAFKTLNLSTKDVTDILDPLSPSEANHLFGVLRTFFNWCERREVIEQSPIRKLTKPHKEKSRRRVLTPDEIKAVWQSTATEQSFDRIVRICLLLGVRRGEAAAIQPEWLQNDMLVIPHTHTKNKHELILPLTPGGHRLIASYAAASSRQLQNTWSKPKAALDAKSGVRNWVLHDLRRSVASHISAPPISAPPHLVDRLLNHRSSTLHRTYNRYEYLSELRQLLSAWEAQLLVMVGEQA